jgi:hypothetical protein
MGAVASLLLSTYSELALPAERCQHSAVTGRPPRARVPTPALTEDEQYQQQFHQLYRQAMAAHMLAQPRLPRRKSSVVPVEIDNGGGAAAA